MAVTPKASNTPNHGFQVMAARQNAGVGLNNRTTPQGVVA